MRRKNFAFTYIYKTLRNLKSMATLKIKGHEIQSIHVKDSCDRRALQYRNKIIELLKTIGVKEDDMDIPMENVAMKKAPAAVSWYFQEHHLHYSYSAASKFVENLAIVHKILELEIAALIEERRSLEEFVLEFREDPDVAERRKAARETLGLDHDVIDMELIDKTYKELAKEHHPDKETGSIDKFKEINHAHKILKRELQ